MIPTPQQERWAEELTLARQQTNHREDGFGRFVCLAEAGRRGGLFQAKALMATITSNPEDNGEGEAVVSVLATFEPRIRILAILEELPRFRDQNELSWAESMVETEARYNPGELRQVGKQVNAEIRKLLVLLLSRISHKARNRGTADPVQRLVLDLTSLG